MRYAFNMVTMMKEKVNTHFSFPLQLNMAPYTEDFLMGDKQEQGTLLHGVAAVQCVRGLMFAFLKGWVLVLEFGILKISKPKLIR